MCAGASIVSTIFSALGLAPKPSPIQQLQAPAPPPPPARESTSAQTVIGASEASDASRRVLPRPRTSGTSSSNLLGGLGTSNRTTL